MLSTTTVTNVHRHVYLYGEIPPPFEIIEELAKWDSDWNYPQENVILHINSNGGSISTTSALIERLRRVNTLYSVCEGDCMSAALFLFILGGQRASVPSALFMAHNAIITSSRDTQDTVGNLNEYVKYIAKMSEDLLTKYLYKTKIVDKKELALLVNGKEIYLDFKEAVQRGIVNTDIENIPQR